jgi:hypothetical protein
LLCTKPPITSSTPVISKTVSTVAFEAIFLIFRI